MHSHQGQYILYYINHQSINPLTSMPLIHHPLTEYFHHRHLWVLLPGLPIQFRNEGALRAIDEALGHFISLDVSSLSSPNRKVGRILVSIDIHEGLPELMEIEWRGRHTKQKLDYQGIPFRCSWCRCTGHL
jgi:hypothetical protein